LVSRDAVLPRCEEIIRLAGRLEQPGRIDPCGVARARVLASDEMGPIYNPASERSLGEAISWIAAGLDMSPVFDGRAAADTPGA
jgi:hypothetical protein